MPDLTSKDTQSKENISLSLAESKAQATMQWFVQPKKDGSAIPGVPAEHMPKITYNNTVEFFICGEKGFGKIAEDLNDAKHSIDIIAWGFDPAMPLKRAASEEWQRGGAAQDNEPYGDILIRKAKELSAKGGKVRVLVWEAGGFAFIKGKLSGNLIGFHERNFSEDPDLPPIDAREKYNRQWFKDAYDGKIEGLEFRTRAVKEDIVEAILKEEHEVDLGFLEIQGLERIPTHHQKPILIDYAHNNGENAVGYVMGLNSVSDYWDTSSHKVDDLLRESLDESGFNDEKARETDGMGKEFTQKYIESKEEKGLFKFSKPYYKRRKPYQDYASRITGGALEALNKNFCEAWDKAVKSRHPTPEAAISSSRTTLPAALAKPPVDGQSAVQIVRTYPDVGEQSIKALYWQATSSARHYIYIENQYFYHEPFAQHLIDMRQKFTDACKEVNAVPDNLHVFIVIPQMERAQMIPRTYDTVKLLGHAESYVEHDKKITPTGSAWHDASIMDSTEHSRKVTRNSTKDLADALGLKVSIAMLRTSDGEDAQGKLAYREIYIHSKLMICDDAFVTLGSANINLRSMAVDSEINMATTDHGKAEKLRKDVFKIHYGNTVDGDIKDIKKIFDNWESRMTLNRAAMKTQDTLEGFLLPYEDHRSSAFRLQ